MKFNTIISYFFLLLLVFAQIADTSSVTKIARNKLQSLNKSHSHAKSARRANKRSTTLTKNNVMLNDPEPENTMTLYALFVNILNKAENIFEFVMGFICEHVTEICTIYKKIKQIDAVFTNVKGCFVTLKNTGQTITEALDSKTQANFIKVETFGAKTHGDQRICESVKIEIQKTHDDQAELVGEFFSNQISSVYGTWIGNFFGNLITSSASVAQPLQNAEVMCSLAGINRQRLGDLIARFGSSKAYKEQCMYFAKQDCTTFNPSTTNLNDFFKKAWGIASSVKDSVKCIADTVKSVTDLLDVSKLIQKWLQKLVRDAGFSVVANALTLGIWAGIKAVYYIIKLGIRIHTFIKAWIDGNTDIFALGQIFANAVSIVKSLLAMRRKRKLMK